MLIILFCLLQYHVTGGLLYFDRHRDKSIENNSYIPNFYTDENDPGFNSEMDIPVEMIFYRTAWVSNIIDLLSERNVLSVEKIRRSLGSVLHPKCVLTLVGKTLLNEQYNTWTYKFGSSDIPDSSLDIRKHNVSFDTTIYSNRYIGHIYIVTPSFFFDPRFTKYNNTSRFKIEIVFSGSKIIYLSIDQYLNWGTALVYFDILLLFSCFGVVVSVFRACFFFFDYEYNGLWCLYCDFRIFLSSPYFLGIEIANNINENNDSAAAA